MTSGYVAQLPQYNVDGLHILENTDVIIMRLMKRTLSYLRSEEDHMCGNSHASPKKSTTIQLGF